MEVRRACDAKVEVRPPSADARGQEVVGLARLAARQHGVVALRQLTAFELSRGQIAGLVRKGHLHRLYRAVYAVGHTRISVRGRWMAAVLACGTEPVLSHATAEALWELRRPPNNDRGCDGARQARARAHQVPRRTPQPPGGPDPDRRGPGQSARADADGYSAQPEPPATAFNARSRAAARPAHLRARAGDA
jgi:Transcriptional regulator, AbiEi antitoxin